MNISARNQIKGKVVSIDKGMVNAKVTLDIGNGNNIVSTITVDAVNQLGLEIGSEAYAIVKSSSVMIGTK